MLDRVRFCKCQWHLHERVKEYFSKKVLCLSLKVFDLLMDGSELIEKVAQNTNLFRSRMTAAGFHIIVSDCKKNCKYLIYKH